MKRSLIVLIIFFVPSIIFYNFHASSNINVTNEKEISIPDYADREYIYNQIVNSLNRGGWIKDESIGIDKYELLEYYIDYFVAIEEQKKWVDILLFQILLDIFYTYDKNQYFILSNGVVDDVSSKGEKGIYYLEKYGIDNENYEYYLGRYSFFTALGYFNDEKKWNYEKALRYFKITTDNKNEEFIIGDTIIYNVDYGKNGDLGDKISIKLDKNFIKPIDFSKIFLEKISEYGGGWILHNNKTQEFRNGLYSELNKPNKLFNISSLQL